MSGWGGLARNLFVGGTELPSGKNSILKGAEVTVPSYALFCYKEQRSIPF